EMRERRVTVCPWAQGSRAPAPAALGRPAPRDSCGQRGLQIFSANYFWQQRKATLRRSVPAPRDSRPDGFAAAFAGTNADAVLQRQHEDLAVADLSRLGGAGGMHDRLDGGLDEGVVDGDFELELGQQPHLELAAAVDLGVAALPAAAADVAHGHEVDVAL